MIGWLKRWKTDNNYIAERRVLDSKCRRYKVVESNIRYGRGVDQRGERLGYPITYRAMILRRVGGWVILSEHRNASAAKSALEYFDEHGKVKPKRVAKAKKRQQDKRKAKKKQREDA